MSVHTWPSKKGTVFSPLLLFSLHRSLFPRPRTSFYIFFTKKKKKKSNEQIQPYASISSLSSSFQLLKLALPFHRKYSNTSSTLSQAPSSSNVYYYSSVCIMLAKNFNCQWIDIIIKRITEK